VIERIQGGLMGLACGDAVGAPLEALTPESIAARYASPEELVSDPPGEVLRYTDDTEMALGVGEALRTRGREATVADYARRYVANLNVGRGYGRGALLALAAIDDGMDPEQAAVSYFPDGSFGNGAAMRVAPVGLAFARDPEALEEHVARSAAPTHAHPHAVEGARLIAQAVGYAARAERFEGDAFRAFVLEQVRDPAYAARLAEVFAGRGLATGVAALESVPTALAHAADHAASYVDGVGRAVLGGGDCDTIAAMTGAILGAAHGLDAIPAVWRERLERGPRGHGYLLQVAEQLAAVARG